MSDRRLWFFLAAAAAAGVLIPATPRELRWVPQMLTVVYLVLAALVTLELLSGGGDDRPR